MKKFTLAATLIATSVSLGAAPAFAESAVYDSQKKIEKALGQHSVSPKAQTRATTFSKPAPVQLDRYQLAHKRLFKFRSPPSGR